MLVGALSRLRSIGSCYLEVGIRSDSTPTKRIFQQYYSGIGTSLVFSGITGLNFCQNTDG